MLAQSWRLARTALLPLLAASFIVFVPAFLAGSLSGLLFPGLNQLLLTLAAGLLGVAFTAPLLGGLYLLSLRRARGEEVAAAMVFSGRSYGTRILSYGIVLVFLSLLPELFGLLAGQLLLLAGQVLFIFTGFFITDRELPAGQALLASARLVLGMPVTMLLWLLTGILSGVAAVLTLGIGLLWLLPLSLVLTAALYDRGSAAA